jgi:hypothetical protein
MSAFMLPRENGSMRTINQIDNRIQRLQALMRRLRVERRLAILREQHQHLKLNGQKNPFWKGVA